MTAFMSGASSSPVVGPSIDGYCRRLLLSSRSRGVSVQDDACGTIEVLDPTGHFEISWKGDPEEVAKAKVAFDALLAKGYLAFKRKFRGKKGPEVEKFDAKLGRVIFDAPQTQESK